jgi:hypothetical protein
LVKDPRVGGRFLERLDRGGDDLGRGLVVLVR